MKQLLIKNIGLLVVDRHGKPCLSGREMAQLDVLRNAWLLVEDGRVKEFGVSDSPCPSLLNDHLETDARGGAVLPSFLGEQDQVAPLFSAKSVDDTPTIQACKCQAPIPNSIRHIAARQPRAPVPAPGFFYCNRRV